ncbi:MAG TPA: hypothetical protein VFO03_12145 [Gaiellaceae bacterium]|nr:hypothetical protein [Gaiellaceae bacterium]
MTLKRLLVVILVVWAVLAVITFVFFSVGGSEPGSGGGDTIEQSAPP